MYILHSLWGLLILKVAYHESEALPNNRPIIGVLAQEYYPSKTEGGADGTYIVASYVKMVEASGARVVPIMTGQTTTYYERIVNSLNGILFPGGSLNLWDKGGYGEAAKILYQLVLQENKRGVHFPLFGVCMGLEALAVVSSNMSKDALSDVKGVGNLPMNLDFLPGSKNSALYSKMPQNLIKSLRTENITSNHHSKSFTRKSLTKLHLDRTWKPLTTNLDTDGVEFISSMEHIKYPQIFGTQFHPEKIVFEWTLKTKDPHTEEAILPNRYFYDYFVEHARRNGNSFRSQAEEEGSLIYNYNPIYSPKAYFQQIYRFVGSTESRYSVTHI